MPVRQINFRKLFGTFGRNTARAVLPNWKSGQTFPDPALTINPQNRATIGRWRCALSSRPPVRRDCVTANSAETSALRQGPQTKVAGLSRAVANAALCQRKPLLLLRLAHGGGAHAA